MESKSVIKGEYWIYLGKFWRKFNKSEWGIKLAYWVLSEKTSQLKKARQRPSAASILQRHASFGGVRPSVACILRHAQDGSQEQLSLGWCLVPSSASSVTGTSSATYEPPFPYLSNEVAYLTELSGKLTMWGNSPSRRAVWQPSFLLPSMPADFISKDLKECSGNRIT